MCLLKKCFKDDVKPAHWVGHLQLRSLYTYDLLLKKSGFDEKQASVTGNTIEKSIYGGGG